MSAKYFSNADFGLSNQAKGFIQQADDEIMLFSSFLDAKASGSGGKGGSPAPQPAETPTGTYLSGDATPDSDEFNVRIDFYGTNWTDALKADFINAANFLSNLILNDIAPNGYDDITISAKLTAIDGAGGVLGQAGPTHIWSGNNLSSKAIMEFDVADAAYFDGINLWDDIVVHEMLHSIGFGTLWDLLGLVETQVIDDRGTRKPSDDIVSSVFVGEMASFHEIYDNPNPLVETDGGSGTAGGHWDDDTYSNELMTGYIDDSNYLSLMSYGALDDMGYAINYSASPADFFLV